MNNLITYPVHRQAVLQNDYRVRIKNTEGEEWIELPTYRVKVDMHDVRPASMAYFDFEGEVIVEVSGPWYIYQADIRPLSKGVECSCDTKKVIFTLKEPANLSIELNRDRSRNLHLFAGEIEKSIPDKEDENTLVIGGSMDKIGGLGGEIIERLTAMEPGRTLYLEPGMYFIGESVLKIPSDTNIYLAGGCILVGGLICSGTENIHIYGRGIIYQADFHRYSGINGVRLSNARNICIDNIIFINPPHYTVYIGGSSDIEIKNIKAFSCEGWSDGIDIMSSRNILVQGGFLRNSDDCIAIYGKRWSYNGDSTNIIVKELAVWADVAHPLMIGTHGDYGGEGNFIEGIRFQDIDILEHNEYQAGYLGCMAINAGDKNTVRNVMYEDIRVEPFLHGKLLDIQVRFNPDYNPAPGRLIENIRFRNVFYQGSREETSVIDGYNEEYVVKDVFLEDIYVNSRKMKNLEEANIKTGKYAFDVRLT
ncbi:glycosyl hydrolase family 28 protein [Anaerocolumna jejuensis]|uniref:glycosyl hydrolase family 28 protein n=1 Tax=Anaerocolumna jejuensis TaxID=259063 RepID=UPI003F7C9AA6